MLPLYIVVFSVGLLIAGLTFKVVVPLAIKLGYVDRPNERKLHTSPVPYGGGVAIFISLSLSGLVFLLPIQLGLWDLSADSFAINLPDLPLDRRTLSVALGASAIFVLGLLDDIYDIQAKLKLLIQTVIVSAVIYFGSVQMSFFVPLPIIGFVGTLLWVLLITNAFNLLDNMDGQCCGITLVTLGIHLTLLLEKNQYLIALITLFVMAPVCIFFFYNRPPAKIYLGDAGSLMLGFIVANLSVLSTYYREGQHLGAIFTPLLVLAVPLFDVATVMFIRYKRGKPFFQGDRNHFSHRLQNLGLSTGQTLATICALSLAMGIGGLMLGRGGDVQALLIFSQAFIILLIVLVLENAGKHTRTKDSSE
ncbi:MAG: undecaprenyl/decaprenyl-phosphate alpha-N-acetylglucosaminyl 1-phosphate transferase [Planctomycetes bacterium]|nr:undecaprenyl/decaprenyl-phosphate alpha-N-acetylglucosaminyl 1-phosphate transferase [Planctomycetota bacterium]